MLRPLRGSDAVRLFFFDSDGIDLYGDEVAWKHDGILVVAMVSERGNANPLELAALVEARLTRILG